MTLRVILSLHTRDGDAENPRSEVRATVCAARTPRVHPKCTIALLRPAVAAVVRARATFKRLIILWTQRMKK